MTNKEAVNWLINITADIGKTEHRDLWHYEQALTEIKDMLESEQPEIVRCGECRHYKPMSSNWGNCYVHGSPTELHRTCQSCDYCSWAERRTE